MARLKYENRTRAGKKYAYARLLVCIDGEEKPLTIGESTTQRHKDRDSSYRKTVSELEVMKATGEKLDAEMRVKLGKIKESDSKFDTRLKVAGLWLTCGLPLADSDPIGGMSGILVPSDIRFVAAA